MINGRRLAVILAFIEIIYGYYSNHQNCLESGKGKLMKTNVISHVHADCCLQQQWHRDVYCDLKYIQKY